ncbi:TonB-dependent receptor [Alteromonas sp. KUL106]|uniref:TonB-dependent receptor domain-containing protein n=1 Tax=Alteromonas sp. KUL106 TaxID=2480799 RepID=UPI0012E41A8B|nr:TonB-dependent receptor [Alteromonas sp. KUL106]GFD69445.1 TonB-dependent receptor [Alteromonas sp. KUL106]
MAFDLSKQNKMTVLACAVASALALNSSVVNAQEETTIEEKDVEKVVVTGSRVAQDSSLEAASPVLAINAGDIKTSGQIDLGAMLRESPQLQASLPGSFSAFNGTPLGASLLNLRNLGSERTLVMENGRRHVSGIEGTGSVDVNTISTALMRNVEVLTGGASAVYGADAVTGVVNFNMRNGASFDGLELRTQSGVSDEMDANEFFISLANGFSSDKGELVFAVEYQETSPVFARDRDFAGSGLYTQVANTSATQAAFGVDSRFANTWVPDYRLPISSDRGVISLTGSAFFDVLGSGGAAGCSTLGSAMIPACQVIGDNGLRAYNPGDVYIGPFDASGGDGVPGSPDSELILPESKRILVQAIANYEVNEYINFFIDTKFVQSETKETNQVNGFNDDIPISLDNPFIPAELLSQINQLEAEGESVSLVMSRDVLDFNATSNPEAQRKTFRVVTGFDGYIPNTELEYEVFYNYGRTDADITSRQRIEDRYFAAIDAVVDPSTGNTVCRSDLDSSALPPTSPFPTVNGNFGFLTFQPGDGSCVPVNLFGKDSISAEAANFIFQPGTDQNDIVQENFLAVVSGTSADLFELPAGPIAFALGYEWRRESSEYTPNTFSALGLTFGELDSRAGPTNPSNGEYDVSEYFMEATIPLLEGMEFAERLELRAAYRSSDYDPYGTHDAWTVGSMWSPVDTFSVRATYSEAVRVPNINEAFAPTFAATLGAGSDPCNQNFIDAGSEFREANCIALIGDAVADGSYDSTNFLSAFVAGTTGGNPDLDPEEAETLTVGTVWRPEGEFDGLFDGLVVTLDYYNIQIDGLIDSLTGFDIASNCVDAPTINNQFCDAVDRDASNGFITNFRSGFINLAAVETSGIDFRVDYGFDLSKFAETDGRLEFSINGTNFLKNDEVRDVSAPNEVTDVLGTFTRPEWIVNMNVDYLIGDFVIGWRGRYEGSQLLPGLENQDIENNPDFISQTHTGSAVVHDFSLSYNFKDNLEVYGGINNAFEEDPYLGTLSRPAGPRGRFYFVGVNYTM